MVRIRFPPAPSHQRTRADVQTMPLRRRRQRQPRWRPGFPLIRRSRSGTADRAEAREGAGDCPPVACRILTRGRGVGPLVGETEPDFTIRNSPLRLAPMVPGGSSRGLSGILLTRRHALRAANAYTFPPPSAPRDSFDKTSNKRVSASARIAECSIASQHSSASPISVMAVQMATTWSSVKVLCIAVPLSSRPADARAQYDDLCQRLLHSTDRPETGFAVFQLDRGERRCRPAYDLDQGTVLPRD